MDATKTPTPEALAEIQEITDRAKSGDSTAVPRLRELLVEYPEIWNHYGDLARQSTAIWIALSAGNDLYLRESLSHKAAALKQDLVGESRTPLVELLVDRVVSTWLEANYFAAMEGSALHGREGLKLLAFRAKRRQQAERSHFAALAAFATVRKLLPVSSKNGNTPVSAPLSKPSHTVPLDLTNRIADYFSDLVIHPQPASDEIANRPTAVRS